MATPMTKQHDIFPRPSTGKASPSLFPNDETNITSSLRDQEAVARALKEETQRLEEGFRIRDEIASLKTANRNLKDGKECAEKEKASAEHAKVLAEKGKILAEKEKALAEDEKRQVEKEVKALKETISKAEATIEKLERFDGCEMYFYNLATQTAIDYDSTKTGERLPPSRGHKLTRTRKRTTTLTALSCRSAMTSRAGRSKRSPTDPSTSRQLFTSGTSSRNAASNSGPLVLGRPSTPRR
jgi:hypothetical protein